MQIEIELGKLHKFVKFDKISRQDEENGDLLT